MNSVPQSASDSKNAVAALELAAIGWRVLPNHSLQDGRCTCGNKDCGKAAKHPRITQWQIDATTDVDTIRKWWASWPDANVGVAPGSASGIFVLDVESFGLEAFEQLCQTHGALPECPTVQTHSGGRHFYLKWPDDDGEPIKSQAKIHGLPIDTRAGDGSAGQAIAPPSRAAKGVYTWLKHPSAVPVPPAPDWLLAWIRSWQRRKETGSSHARNGTTKSPFVGRVVSGNRERRYGLKALDGEAAIAASTPEGARNDQLNRSTFRAAQLIHTGAISEREVRDAMTAAGLAAGLGGSETRMTVESGLEAGKLNPRDIPPDRAAWPETARIHEPIEAPDDPHRLARVFANERRTSGGDLTTRWFREEWWVWRGGAYVPLLDKELKADLTGAVKEEFDRLQQAEYLAWEAAGGKSKDGKDCGPPVARKVTGRLVADVASALAGYVRVDGRLNQPAWLSDGEPFPACEALVFENGILHVPAWAAGRPSWYALTPDLFTANQLPYAFDPTAPAPSAWFRFLEQVWPDDHESIDLLQEWFGYCLLPDTNQQKIGLLVGPRRSGKGTIARVLTRLVGPENVVSPTLASLGLPFGLQPLLGKTVGIVSDARLSGRTDTAVVLERLLSISGEDSISVDRKHLSAVTGKLPVRFTIMTNELPRLSDASNALVGRLLVMRMTRSFYGNEDTALTGRLLGELPGVLLWALEGWKRLQERGHFVQPSSAAHMLQRMEDLASPLGAFLRERCLVEHGQSVSRDDLFDAWRKWAEARNERCGSAQSFGRDLHAAVPDLDIRQPRLGGHRRVRVYHGVGLRPDDDDVASF